MCKLLIGDVEAQGVRVLIDVGLDLKTVIGACIADEVDNHRAAQQWAPAPVLRDVAEHAVLDFIPLAGTRGEVADRNLQSELVGQLLKAPLPEAVADSVA